MPGTAWATGCKSWYIGADGLPELWTYSPKEYFDLMTGIDYANYAIRVSNPHTPARNR